VPGVLTAISRADPRRALSAPWVYELFQRAVGKDRLRRRFVDVYVSPAAGQTVLDIGCGPGDLLRFLPPVDYTGFDISEQYIASARTRFPEASFVAGTLDDLGRALHAPADIVLTLGVLHHVDDAEAHRILDFASSSLRPGGRFVALEPHLHAGQHPISKLLVSSDRGRFVRDESDYVDLCRSAFQYVEVNRDDAMLRLPYSVVVLDCTNERD
jgi:SAM-dependent methyltransferase